MMCRRCSDFATASAARISLSWSCKSCCLWRSSAFLVSGIPGRLHAGRSYLMQANVFCTRMSSRCNWLSWCTSDCEPHGSSHGGEDKYHSGSKLIPWRTCHERIGGGSATCANERRRDAVGWSVNRRVAAPGALLAGCAGPGEASWAGAQDLRWDATGVRVAAHVASLAGCTVRGALSNVSQGVQGHLPPFTSIVKRRACDATGIEVAGSVALLAGCTM